MKKSSKVPTYCFCQTNINRPQQTKPQSNLDQQSNDWRNFCILSIALNLDKNKGKTQNFSQLFLYVHFTYLKKIEHK